MLTTNKTCNQGCLSIFQSVPIIRHPSVWLLISTDEEEHFGKPVYGELNFAFVVISKTLFILRAFSSRQSRIFGEPHHKPRTVTLSVSYNCQ
jgi:hypothetical protein